MVKIQIKFENLTPFGGIFQSWCNLHNLNLFDSILSNFVLFTPNNNIIGVNGF